MLSEIHELTKETMKIKCNNKFNNYQTMLIIMLFVIRTIKNKNKIYNISIKLITILNFNN